MDLPASHIFIKLANYELAFVRLASDVSARGKDISRRTSQFKNFQTNDNFKNQTSAPMTRPVLFTKTTPTYIFACVGSSSRRWLHLSKDEIWQSSETMIRRENNGLTGIIISKILLHCKSSKTSRSYENFYFWPTNKMYEKPYRLLKRKTRPALPASRHTFSKHELLPIWRTND